MRKDVGLATTAHAQETHEVTKTTIAKSEPLRFPIRELDGVLTRVPTRSQPEDMSSLPVTERTILILP